MPLVNPLKTTLATKMEKAGSNPYGLLLNNSQGLPLNPDTESGRLPKALPGIRITHKKTKLHDLRHTIIDLLYEAGVPEDIIMEIVSHSTHTVTRGYKA